MDSAPPSEKKELVCSLQQLRALLHSQWPISWCLWLPEKEFLDEGRSEPRRGDDRRSLRDAAANANIVSGIIFRETSSRLLHYPRFNSMRSASYFHSDFSRIRRHFQNAQKRRKLIFSRVNRAKLKIVSRGNSCSRFFLQWSSLKRLW